MYENYDVLFPDQRVVDLYLPIWAGHVAFGNKPAFKWVDETGDEQCSLTYSQLHASASTIASNLLAPLKRGDSVLVLCPPGIEFVNIIFGCQRAGLVSVPMLPPHPNFTQEDRQKLVRILLQTRACAAIAHPAYIASAMKYVDANKRAHLGILLKKMRWISIDSLFNASETPVFCHEGRGYKGCGAEDLFLIQYTSGGTDIPKPVMLSAGSAAHNVRAARKAYDLEPSSVIVSWLPQYHDCGLMFLLLTVVSAATCVMTSPFIFIKNPILWLELVTKYKATCTPVPSFALPLAQHEVTRSKRTMNLRLGSLRNLIVINEPIYSSVVEGFVGRFSEFGLDASAMAPSYGLAENCTFVSTAWKSAGNEDHNFIQSPRYRSLLPSSRVSSQSELGIEMIVVNPKTCEEAEAGQEGEIWICSPSNASGYLGNPSLTREVFRAKLKGRRTSRGDLNEGKLYLRTGDLGVITGGHEQYLYVTGRMKDVIKVGNQAVHPHYLETTAFMSCASSLRAGCAAAFEVDVGLQKMIVVLAELQNSKHVYNNTKGICENIVSCIEKEHGVSAGLVGLVKARSVPKTTSGKIQRWKARRMLLRGEIELVEKMWWGDSAKIDVEKEGLLDEASVCGRYGESVEEIPVSADPGVSHGFLRALL